MELTKSKQALVMQKTLSIDNHSRQKALQKLEGKEPKVSDQSINILYELFFKIGAKGELPAIIDKNDRNGIARRVAYLTDFYKTIYLKNPVCPGDIPFDIIFQEFNLYAVLNSHERKGNNQAAICRQFNDWVQKAGTRNKLLEARNLAYPESKPIALSERSVKPVSLAEYTTEALKDKRRSLTPFKGLESVDAMLDEINKELESR